MKTMYYHRKKFFFAPLAIVALALFAWVTMLLWNALLPAILSVSSITFWQAAGLLILARLLFGGMHSHWKRPWSNSKMDYELRHKIKNMTPEERKEFFRKMHYRREAWYREHCGENHKEETTEEQIDR